MSKHAGNRTGRQAKRRRARHERRARTSVIRSFKKAIRGLPRAATPEQCVALEKALGQAHAAGLPATMQDLERVTGLSYTLGVDLAAGPDRTVLFAPRADKAKLFRSGRVVIRQPPPDLEGEERPLTDSELALRYTLESMRIPVDRLGDGRLKSESGLREYYGLDSDWSAKYLPPKTD